MADAILGVILEQLIENVNSLIHKEVHLFFGVKNDAEKLSRTLSTVRDVLEDAESRKIKDKSLANWLKMLKDAAYDATDALDEWALKVQQLDEAALTDKGCTSQVSDSMLSCLNLRHTIFRRNMVKRFKDIINKFDEIAAERSKFHLSSVVVETGSQFDASRETSSTLTEPKIYGRDGDKKAIIDMLLGNVSREENVSICPIVGIGGLGKTALAQLVYNDERVTSCFDVKIWVCVSDPFDLKRVLKAIIESLNMVTPNLQNLDPIQNKVAELLRGKRYLLVLDDVWIDNQHEWNRLKTSLMGGAKGSSIIVTTRLNIVASITGTAQNYYLKPLSDDDCWTLFKSHAFSDRDEENLVLTTIGKEIVKKCRGVPLAAKSLGSSLWFKPDESYWKLVRDNEVWNLEEDVECGILPALRLSYKHLRPQLKRCFAYCSIYPKDHYMDKDELIRLWIANDFIQSNGGMELEDIGNLIFNELLWRSFFQYYDGHTYCTIHDLMHDLASSVMEGDCLSLEGDMNTKQVIKTRYLWLNFSIVRPPSADLHCFFKSQTYLSSLIFFKHATSYHVAMSSFPNLTSMINFSNHRCLRALNLTGMRIKTLPSSICLLKLLRYLNLSHNYITSLPDTLHRLRSLQILDLAHNMRLATLPPSIGKLESLRYFNISRSGAITSLPESIGSLKNLRSLILQGCRNLQVLPRSMKNINKLRHLDIDGCSSLTKMPVGTGGLTCLETLTRFVVGRYNDCKNGRCGSVSELKNLNHLRGKLGICGLENIRNVEEVKEANLGDKRYLTELFIESSKGSNDQGGNSCIEALDHISPPPYLEKLSIDGYPGVYLQKFLGSFTSLKKLNIYHCETMKCLPMMIGIQQDSNNNIISSLVELLIWECKNLTSVSEGLKYQTSLQSLWMEDCPKLELAVHDLQHLVSLQNLEIFKCDNLRRLPEGLKHLTALQSLEIGDCPELELAMDDLQHLVSLRSLQLENLPKVTSLPEPVHLTMLQKLLIWECKSLRRLPEGLKHVSALQTLVIRDCHPELQTRCEKDKGQDWHIISHIPHLHI